MLEFIKFEHFTFKIVVTLLTAKLTNLEKYTYIKLIKILMKPLKAVNFLKLIYVYFFYLHQDKIWQWLNKLLII